MYKFNYGFLSLPILEEGVYFRATSDYWRHGMKVTLLFVSFVLTHSSKIKACIRCWKE